MHRITGHAASSLPPTPALAPGIAAAAGAAGLPPGCRRVAAGLAAGLAARVAAGLAAGLPPVRWVWAVDHPNPGRTTQPWVEIRSLGWSTTQTAGGGAGGGGGREAGVRRASAGRDDERAVPERTRPSDVIAVLT